MLTFFDYIYYWICRGYYKTRESNPRITGLCIISLIQTLNVSTILGIVYSIIEKKLASTGGILAIFYIILLILNGFRYNKFNYDVLNERWKDEETNTQTRKGRIAWLYIILSTIICIGLAIYIGSKKW